MKTIEKGMLIYRAKNVRKIFLFTRTRAKVKKMVIESISNSKIQLLRSIYGKNGREESGLFVVEGVNMVRDIPDFVEVVYYFVSDKKTELLDNWVLFPTAERVVVKDALFERIADTKTPQGLIAVCKIPTAVDYRKLDRIMILDGVRDPGNVGTIIRTAGASGIQGVLLFDSADPYSPKCVRSTMGGIFRVQIQECDYSSFDWSGDVYALDMHGTDIFEEKPSDKYAIVVGNEAHGVSDYFRKRANKTLSIPMQNNTESLNAGVSASLSMYILEHNRRS